MPSAADPLQTFASELRRFKIECGDPSLVKIARSSEKCEPRLSKSTIGDVMNGKRMPGLDSTMSLIRSLIACGGSSAPVSRDDPRLKEWRTRWRDTKGQLDELRRTTRTHQIPSPSSSAARPPRARASTESPSPEPPHDRRRADQRSEATFRPTTGELPVQRVQRLRSMLKEALDETDIQGRRWANALGCFAFFDYDGDPLYVDASSGETLSIRIRRHLISQRTDAVAAGILDVQEVAEMEVWPMWNLKGMEVRPREDLLRRAKREIYLQAVEASRFGTLMNEKVPAKAASTVLPPSRKFALVDEQSRSEQGHADVRIARQAATAARLSSLFLERGAASEGARRALVLQSARLTYLAANHLAYVRGRPAPSAHFVDVPGLLGGDDGLAEPHP